MDLWDGEIHQSSINQSDLYRKLLFKKHRITMNGDQFSFQQSGPGGPRGDRELGTHAMLTIVDSLTKIRNVSFKSLQIESERYLLINSSSPFSYSQLPVVKVQNPDVVFSRALEKIRTSKNIVLASFRSEESIQEQVNSYMVEIHKKYALPVACIVFILIGAPLGVMVRKGGFGVAASISLFFFVIYWAFLIGAKNWLIEILLLPSGGCGQQIYCLVLPELF